jgi:plastocyanin
MSKDRLQHRASAAMLLCMGWLGAAASAGANDLNVQVRDKDAAPVAGIAIYAVPLLEPAERRRPEATASMNQRDGAFVPHILIVESGTAVHFPNSDSVSHHVYSFSQPHPFELPLYKGSVHPPLRFDAPGTIVVGCNIHDDMLGYILVVDTPHFAKTDSEGRVNLRALPDGDYSIRIWTPRLDPESLPAPRRVSVVAGSTRSLDYRFTERLLPAHDDSETDLHWLDY